MLISFYVHLLPVHAAVLASVRTTTVWQMNTTDQPALWNANQTQRNATALASSIAPTQTAQVLTFNARTLITASDYAIQYAGRSHHRDRPAGQADPLQL